MSLSREEFSSKTSIQLRYIPPANPQEPADCKTVLITRYPEIRIFTGQRSVLEGRPQDELIGLDYLGHVLSLEEGGRVTLFFQVGTYIEWAVGFRTKQNTFVTEVHRIFVSMPVFYPINAPMIMIGRALEWWANLARYSAAMWAWLRKIEEFEKILGVIALLQTGWCQDDIQRVKEALRKIEEELKEQYRRAELQNIAKLVHEKAPDLARYVGSSPRRLRGFIPADGGPRRNPGPMGIDSVG